MEEIIEKIMEIEDRAQEIISDAKKADNGLDESIAEKSKEIEADIERRAHEREEYVKNVEEKDTEEKISAVKKEFDEKIAGLESQYKANKDAWVNGIVENVIGRRMN